MRPTARLPVPGPPTAARLARARILLAVACVASLATAASAQSTRVTSGEHEDFSRLVIRLDRPTEWRVTREPDGYRIRFDPPAAAFDLAGVFDLIPRDRIETVSQSEADGSLFIGSTCDCHVETFEAARWTLAVDVKDGPDPAEAGADADPAVAPVAGQTRPVATGAVTPLLPPVDRDRTTATGTVRPWQPEQVLSTTIAAPPPFNRLDLTLPLLPTAQPGDAARPLTQPDPGSGDAGSATAAAAPPARPDDEPTAEGPPSPEGDASLQARLERAEARGLIDLEGPETALWGTRPEPASDSEALAAVAARLEALEENLQLRSMFDGLDRDGAAEAPDLVCVPDHVLAFLRADARYGDDLAVLSELRVGLVDDRGEVVASGARALMEHYLAMGLGVEAAALTGLAGLSDAEAAMYRSIATIVDEREDDAPEVWAGQQSCEGAAALWAVLGQASGLSGPGADLGAVQRAFFDLDMRLRLHLGPRLADRLAALGHDEAAAAIGSNVAPLIDVGPDGAPELAPGSTERAVTDLLDRVAESIGSGQGVSQEDLDLAEALAWEYDGTEEGLKLDAMSALGRLQRNDLQGAMSLLESQWQSTDQGWVDTLEQGLALVVLSMGDADLLRFALHPDSGGILAMLDQAQSQNVAARLVDLGFPDRALDVLDATFTAALGWEAPDRQRLRARAVLDTGDPLQALALLAGLDDPPAARIRAEAHARLGNHVLAADAYARAGDPDAAAWAAWVSGDAVAIGRHGTEMHQLLAREIDPASGLETDAQDTPGAVPRPDDVGADVRASAALPAPTEAGLTEAGLTDTVPTDSGPGDPSLADQATASAAQTRLPPGFAAPSGAPDTPSLAAARALVERSARVRDALSALLPDAAEPRP